MYYMICFVDNIYILCVIYSQTIQLLLLWLRQTSKNYILLFFHNINALMTLCACLQKNYDLILQKKVLRRSKYTHTYTYTALANHIRSNTYVKLKLKIKIKTIWKLRVFTRLSNNIVTQTSHKYSKYSFIIRW